MADARDVGVQEELIFTEMDGTESSIPLAAIRGISIARANLLAGKPWRLVIATEHTVYAASMPSEATCKKAFHTARAQYDRYLMKLGFVAISTQKYVDM